MHAVINPLGVKTLGRRIPTPASFTEGRHCGPTSLEDAQRFMVDLLGRFQFSPVQYDELAVSSHRCIVTSKWCGVGGMHIAFSYFTDAIAKVYDRKVRSLLYSMCDKSPPCQSLLRRFIPLHMHNDLLDPYDVDEVAALKSFIDNRRMMHDRFRQRVSDRDRRILFKQDLIEEAMQKQKAKTKKT